MGKIKTLIYFNANQLKVKTKKGNYIVLEYKGEDRLRNEDTEYKTKLGKLWEALNSGVNKFYLVGRTSIDSVLKEMSAISDP